MRSAAASTIPPLPLRQACAASVSTPSATALRTQRPERAASADSWCENGPAPGPRLQARPSVGTRCLGRTGRPSRRARNGAEARPCRAMPRHNVVKRSRNTFSMKIFLETTPVKAASSWRSANAGPARPYVSWDTRTKRHAPVSVRAYLSRFSTSLASADTPAPQAVAATTEDASG